MDASKTSKLGTMVPFDAEDDQRTEVNGMTHLNLIIVVGVKVMGVAHTNKITRLPTY